MELIPNFSRIFFTYYILAPIIPNNQERKSVKSLIIKLLFRNYSLHSLLRIFEYFELQLFRAVLMFYLSYLGQTKYEYSIKICNIRNKQNFYGLNKFFILFSYTFHLCIYSIIFVMYKCIIYINTFFVFFFFAVTWKYFTLNYIADILYKKTQN